MINFYDLEKRCKKVQQKKIQKLIIYFLIGMSILGIILFFITKQNKFTKNKIEIQKPAIKVEKKIKKSKPIETIKLPEQKVLKQKKVIKIEKKVNNSNNLTKKTTTKPIPIINYSIEIDNIKEVNFSVSKPIEVKKKQEKNITLQTTTQTRKKESLSLKTKVLTFEKAKNSALLYYKNGNYKETIKWCKIASALNNENEEIWKLYSLSLERMGNTKKAIKVLKTYLKYKDSTELKLILERLEK